MRGAVSGCGSELRCVEQSRYKADADLMQQAQARMPAASSHRNRAGLPTCVPLSPMQAAAAAGLNTSHLTPATSGQQGVGELPPPWGVDPAVLESSGLYYPPLPYSMGECGSSWWGTW